MLEPMDEQLNPKTQKRNPDWVKESVFFNEVVNDLKSVKRVWRDTTMHVDKDYSEKEAARVFDAVESLMQHVAKRLDQDGNFH